MNELVKYQFVELFNLFVLSGWVAVTGEEKVQYDLKVYTPECRGIHIRNPPLLPFAVNLKGRRSQGSLAHSYRRLFI